MKWIIAIALVLCSCHFAYGQVRCCNDKCFCDNNIINCENKNIHNGQFPCTKSEATSIGISRGTILLTGNYLSSLDLGQIPTGIQKVVARNCHIFTIHTSGAGGLTVLDVRNNQITNIDSLAALTNLTELDVSLNPIPENQFSNSLFRILGRTLKTLHFGYSNLNRFPDGISHHLPLLENLEMTNVNIPYLPPTAFTSFRYKISNLTIRNTNMQNIPFTLQQLPNLKELHFDGNPIGDYGIIASAFEGLKGLNVLSLRNDQLTKFPSIVEKLPNITSLALDDNNLLTIRDEAINMVNNSGIRELSLANCSLDRIPGALGINGQNYLSNLHLLNLDRNNIQSIDHDDIHDLMNLETLSLYKNPLHYISNCAFHGLSKLQEVNLMGTNLDEIPRALTNLVNTQHGLTVHMNNTGIECTCSMASFQKTMYGSGKHMRVEGDCNTIEMTIGEYLTQRIPNCPNYHMDDVITNHC